MATCAISVPASFDEAAHTLSRASRDDLAVRIVGAGTKRSWGNAGPEAAIELRTAALDAIVEHNAGDLTATLQAGVPLARAQRTFAAAGQMLALDPPLRGDPGPTIGGVFATGDAGPLAHRYGGARDLIIGVTVALSDGTIASAGGKVIKNVAGYDLAKLFTGSFGTLGLILSVNVRLHPLARDSATALGHAGDPAVLAGAAIALAAFPVEFDALDIAWRGGRGGILARCTGGESGRRAQRAAGRMRELGLSQIDVTNRDGELWALQRAGQRSRDRGLVRIRALPSALPSVLVAADGCGAAVVGRAALGESYAALDPDRIADLRAALPAGATAIVLDAPEHVRAKIDPWGPVDPAALALMTSVKARFDPTGTCNPGRFVGGI